MEHPQLRPEGGQILADEDGARRHDSLTSAISKLLVTAPDTVYAKRMLWKFGIPEVVCKSLLEQCVGDKMLQNLVLSRAQPSGTANSGRTHAQKHSSRRVGISQRISRHR